VISPQTRPSGERVVDPPLSGGLFPFSLFLDCPNPHSAERTISTGWQLGILFFLFPSIFFFFFFDPCGVTIIPLSRTLLYDFIRRKPPFPRRGSSGSLRFSLLFLVVSPRVDGGATFPPLFRQTLKGWFTSFYGVSLAPFFLSLFPPTARTP